jgi:hypothetical protein
MIIWEYNVLVWTKSLYMTIDPIDKSRKCDSFFLFENKKNNCPLASHKKKIFSESEGF